MDAGRMREIAAGRVRRSGPVFHFLICPPMKYESEWAAIECQSRGVGLSRRRGGCYHVNLHHISNKRREMAAVSNEPNCFRDPVGHKRNDRRNAENRLGGKQTCDRNVESPRKKNCRAIKVASQLSIWKPTRVLEAALELWPSIWGATRSA